MKKLIRIIHSIIWWLDWVLLMMLAIALDTIIWPGNRKMYRRYERFWAWTLMKIGGISLEIKGHENLPKENETVIYMPNHQSDLDWPIIFRAVPRQYLFLAKQELFDMFIFGTYMRLQGYIPIERNNIKKSYKTYQRLIDLIKEGNSIVIYPEGTRSYDGRLQRFKPTSFSILQETKVKVIPIAINGSVNFIKKGSRIIYPTKIKVDIFPVIDFSDLYHLESKDFCLASSERVRKVLLTVLPGEEPHKIKNSNLVVDSEIKDYMEETISIN